MLAAPSTMRTPLEGGATADAAKNKVVENLSHAQLHLAALVQTNEMSRLRQEQDLAAP